jgi:hypothetical protein
MLMRVFQALAACLFLSAIFATPSFAEGEVEVETQVDEEVAAPPPPPAVSASVMFPSLAGRWVGEGRLGIKDNKPESVKCRATYIAGASADELKQTIRCATAGGSIEVISNLVNASGKLSGKWQETVHNIGGELEGAFTSKGLRITVKGSDLAANMDVIVMNNKQVIEIQFFNSTLIGLTLLMKKG